MAREVTGTGVGVAVGVEVRVGVGEAVAVGAGEGVRVAVAVAAGVSAIAPERAPRAGGLGDRLHAAKPALPRTRASRIP
jgi:hypothetical protein